MADILSFGVEETGVIELTGANDEPLIDDDGVPLTVTVYGPGSKTYTAAQAKNQNRMVDKLRKKGTPNQSAAEKVREQAEFLASCTKSFSGNIQYGDGSLTGNELFIAVYSDERIGFIAEQVGKYISDWSNFTKGRPKN